MTLKHIVIVGFQKKKKTNARYVALTQTIGRFLCDPVFNHFFKTV